MKSKVLQSLKNSSGEYLSGEALSESLGVTRTAVWKHIKELKSEGYEIESSPKKGYRLISVPDVLSSHEISFGLGTEKIGKKIVYLKSVDSTNNYAKKLAFEGCEDGTLVVAECQTSGRGRLGRLWNSVEGMGIWMSVVLRPEILPEEVQIITLAASVAVAKAIEAVTGIKAGIKWPNDIILDGKKVCGILTEMNSEMERVNYLVLGMGINVNQLEESFPEELRTVATSLRIYMSENKEKCSAGNLNKMLGRKEIIQRLLFELEKIYSTISIGLTDEVIKEWKKYSVTLGQQVEVVSKNGGFSGLAEDITKDGRLVLTLSDGTKRELLSGEVSIRGLQGYTG